MRSACAAHRPPRYQTVKHNNHGPRSGEDCGFWTGARDQQRELLAKHACVGNRGVHVSRAGDGKAPRPSYGYLVVGSGAGGDGYWMPAVRRRNLDRYDVENPKQAAELDG